MRAQIVVRARYSEDALQAHNPSQYLVLAAGLDTFALRHATLDMRVFEVDHPATQAWKRSKIDEAPANLLFVPVDFERTTLSTALDVSPFDGALTTFVAWLGTTYYLSLDARAQTLRGVRERTRRAELRLPYPIGTLSRLTPAIACSRTTRRAGGTGGKPIFGLTLKL